MNAKHILHVLKPGVLSRSIELRPGMNRLGRNPLNDQVFTDPAVSGFHCEIEVSAQGILVRDLGSTNGTLIDGRPVRQASLQTGQTLRIGEIDLVLDALPVPIAIPPLAVPQIDPPHFLPDGSPACQMHPTVRATLHCSKCNKTYCLDCVKLLGRAGGRKLRLCPACSSICDAIEITEARKAPKPSLLDRISKSMRSVWRRCS